MTSNNREPMVNTQLQVARQLWFGSYHGVLSSHSAALPGYPFGSLAPVCRDYDGLPLLLLSHLAQHTKNLRDNPLCSLMLLEQGRGDIQQLGRLTCLATAKKLEIVTESLRRRFFRYFPDTREYYEKLNFHFYRLIPKRFYLIGGFGAARWFEPSHLLPEFVFTAEEEAELLSQIHSHPPFTASVYQHFSPVGIDCLGLDLYSDNQLSRVMLPGPSKIPDYLENLGRIINLHHQSPDS